MTEHASLGVRFTIGDVSEQGFEALRFSIWGARKVFGPAAAYVVCVNTVDVDEARERVGEIPEGVSFRAVKEGLPPFLREHFDASMAEGVGWKLSPLRLFPDRFCLALDNDCILWGMPPSIHAWLDDAPARCLIAEDVRACFGKFADLCGPEPRNAGIRGLPPGFDLEDALRGVLEMRPGLLTSELDEQGLQVAAVSKDAAPHVVSLRDVAISSPFPPHLPGLGRCGVHFVGLNVKQAGWDYRGKPGEQWIREHWERHREEVARRVMPC